MMKTITTKIPNNHNKQDYVLMHVDTHTAIILYLRDLPKWVKEGGLADWMHEVQNELDEGTRRI